jgi:hypothetical protein
MSNYIDINQLLNEIGGSDRSATDPWTLSRNYRRSVDGNDPFRPEVMADMGAPIEELQAAIDSSERITAANDVALRSGASAQSEKSSGGGGLFGGLFGGFFGDLLNALPMAKGIAGLFGFGDSSSAPQPALMPYELPPSIIFQGALSGPSSGVTSVSYGQDGLPRIVGASDNTPSVGSSVIEAVQDLISYSNGSAGPANQGQVMPLPPAESTYLAGATLNSVLSDATFLAFPGGMTNREDTLHQFTTLTGDTFTPAYGTVQPNFGVDYFSAAQLPLSNSYSSLAGTLPVDSADTTNVGSSVSNTNETNNQQGHSILVQVQAMDSQSFMDHSHEIAQAVRQAMLNLSSVNDVILDL